MKTLKKTFAILTAIILFSDCSCGLNHSRDCAGFYYDYNDWRTVDDNDTLVFTKSSGDSIRFILKTIDLSDPYEGYGNGSIFGGNDPSNVWCWMRGGLYYHCPELEIDLLTVFDQIEQYEQPLEEQDVWISYEFKKNTDSTYIDLHSFQIEPVYKESYKHNHLYDSLTLNGTVYYDVFESRFEDTTFYKIDPAYSFWKLQVTRGKGIIYLQDMSGKEYFLKE